MNHNQRLKILAVTLMLVAAAAKQWNVAPSEITARDSTLSHAASGKKATYGSLATAAAKMPVPDPTSTTNTPAPRPQ